MRSSIAAQSCASVPPLPAWISTKHGFGIHRIVEHPAELHVVDDAFELGDVAFERNQRRVVALRAGHFEQFGAVREPGAEVSQRVDDAFELLLLAPSSCARFWSSQTLGSSRSPATAFSRSALASKSKIPPQVGSALLQTSQEIGEKVDSFGFHCGPR